MQGHKRQRFDPWVRKTPSSRKWHPTPAFLPGKFHGQRSLAGTVHGVTKSQTRLSWQHTQAHESLTLHRSCTSPHSPHLTTGGGVFRAGDHPAPFLVQWIVSALLCRTWTLLHRRQRRGVRKGPSWGPPGPRASVTLGLGGATLSWASMLSSIYSYTWLFCSMN